MDKQTSRTLNSIPQRLVGLGLRQAEAKVDGVPQLAPVFLAPHPLPHLGVRSVAHLRQTGQDVHDCFLTLGMGHCCWGKRRGEGMREKKRDGENNRIRKIYIEIYTEREKEVYVQRDRVFYEEDEREEKRETERERHRIRQIYIEIYIEQERFT